MKSIEQSFGAYLVKRRNDLIKPYIRGNSLDLGCGPAYGLKFVKNKKNYTGIELESRLVKELNKRFNPAKFYSRDLLKDKFRLSKKFDTILLIAVIEYLNSMDNLFSEISRCLKNDGHLIITSPTNFGNKIHYLLSIFRITSKKAVEEHCNIVDYKKMKQFLKKYNMQIKEYKKFELDCNQFFVIQKIN